MVQITGYCSVTIGVKRVGARSGGTAMWRVDSGRQTYTQRFRWCELVLRGPVWLLLLSSTSLRARIPIGVRGFLMLARD